MDDEQKLSNIREHLGWLIGKRIIDVTSGDPPHVPDHDEEDAGLIIIHVEGGGTLEVSIDPEDGFTFFNPDTDEGDVDVKPEE